MQRLLEADRELDEWRAREPWRWYEPSEPGMVTACGRVLGPWARQRFFHESTHLIRQYALGNRAGKTSAMAMEAFWTCTRQNPYHPNPTKPGSVIWACPSFDQFEILLPELRELAWGPSSEARYVKQQYVEFPNGGRVYPWPKGRDWESLKGINPDLFVVDEWADEEFWYESQARGFGKQVTRYVIGSTPTEAMGTWMETQIYQPWRKFHADLGMTEEEAIVSQRHPRIFCLTRGGIAENPSIPTKMVEEFRAKTWRGGEAEWQVRNYGGFRYIGSNSVFSGPTLQAVGEDLASANDEHGAGTTGFLHPVDRTVPGVVGMLTLKASALIEKRFTWKREAPGEHGRITIYEHPKKGHQYTLGFDAAYGLEDGDWDALSIVDATETPPRQVATAWGHWGNRFSRIVYPLAMYYNEAFVMGERQVGLFTLQELAGEFGYDDLYRQRKIDTRTKHVTERLGWPRVGNDITLQTLRNRLDERTLVMRCPETLLEMQRMVWERPETGVGLKRDSKVRGVMLRGGGSPDKVVALCYAVQAIDELAHEEPKKVKRKPKGWEYESLPEDDEADEPEKDAVDDMFGS